MVAREEEGTRLLELRPVDYTGARPKRRSRVEVEPTHSHVVLCLALAFVAQTLCKRDTELAAFVFCMAGMGSLEWLLAARSWLTT